MKNLLNHGDEEDGDVSLNKTVPSKQIVDLGGSEKRLPWGVQVCIATDPWPAKYDSYMSINSKSACAFSRQEVMATIDL
jgi:hypothetical protein